MPSNNVRIAALTLENDGVEHDVRVISCVNAGGQAIAEFPPHINDWSRGPLDKAVIAAKLPKPLTPDRQAWVAQNVKAHAPYISERTSLFHHAGMAAKDTVVLVAPGPSSGGIERRLAGYRDIVDVMALNRAGGIEGLNPEYFMALEAHGMAVWWEKIDPKRTTLVCLPMLSAAAAEKWKGENVLYGWMPDCGDPKRHPEFEPLGCLTGAHSVTTVAIHALAVMGYKRILMVGVDLAVGDDVKIAPGPTGGRLLEASAYSDGTKLSQCYIKDFPLFQVRTPFGLCWTTNDFMAQRECVSTQMDIAWDAGIEVYNCSGRGILDNHAGALETLLMKAVSEKKVIPCPVMSSKEPLLTGFPSAGQ